MIRITKVADPAELKLNRRSGSIEAERVVAPIIEAVRDEGDAALLRFARQFDGLGDSSLRIPQAEIESAAASLTPGIIRAVETAIQNIRQYAEAQLPKACFREFGPGRKLGWIVRPLEAVGCYIPSGRYPLAFHFIDDRGSGTSRGRETNLRNVAEAVA